MLVRKIFPLMLLLVQSTYCLDEQPFPFNLFFFFLPLVSIIHRCYAFQMFLLVKRTKGKRLKIRDQGFNGEYI